LSQLLGICLITLRRSGVSFMCLTIGLWSHSVLPCLTWRTKSKFFLFVILLSLFLPIFISHLSVPSSSKALSSKRTISDVASSLYGYHVLPYACSCLPLCRPRSSPFTRPVWELIHVPFDPTEQTNT